MENFEPIDVEFIINSEEVKRDAEKVRKELSGVGETAEKVERDVQRSVRRVATEQDQVLSKLRGTTRTTLRDAMEAFQEMEPSVRTNISQLVRFEAQLKRLRDTEKELNNDLRRGTITQGQYNRAMEGIRAETQRTSQAMRELAKEVQNAGKEVELKELSFDRMDKGINRVNKNLLAFGYSAQMGFSGLANNLPMLVEEVINMDQATKQMNASGQKSPSVFKQIISGILNWQTALVVGITLIATYRKEIWQFIQGLFGVEKALDTVKAKQELFNKGMESSSVKQAVTNVLSLKTNLELAKDGMIDATVVVDEYNESIGKVTTEVKTLAEVEQGLIDNADNYIKATLAKAAANETAERFAKLTVESKIKELELEDKLIESQRNLERQRASGVRMSGTGATSNVSNAEQRLRNSEFALEEHRKKVKEELDQLEKVFSDFEKEAAGFGINLYGEKSKVKPSKVLSERRSLLEKIAALDAEYARKSLTKDEEEVQALRDKFAKVRALVTEFNNNPANRANRIDITGLDAVEDNAMSDLTYRQQTNRLKTNLEEQKRLYQEYDRIVADFGIQEAERRFQGQLDSSRNFIDLVREEFEKLASLDPSSLSGGQSERLSFLGELLRKEEDEQRKQMDGLLKTLQDYNNKRELMIEQHLLRVEELRKSGNVDYIAEETRRHQEEIKALDIAQIKKIEMFEDFFQRVDTMSTRNAKKLIADIRATIVQLREEFPNLTKFFDDMEVQLLKTEMKISERLPRDIMEMAQGFRRVAQEIGGANQGLANMFGLLSYNLARIAEIQRGMANFSAARAAGDGFGSVVAGAGVAGAVIGGIVQLNALMQQANQRQTEILKKQLDFQRQLFFGELEINRLVRERRSEQARIDGQTLATLMAQREALRDNYRQVREDIEGIESIFNQKISQTQLDQLSLYDIRTKTFKNQFEKKMAELGQSLFVEGTKTVRGGFLGLGRKEVEVFGSLAGKSFEDIERLFAEGRLTKEAEKLFLELRKLKEEGQEVERALRDIENQMKNILTGGATAEEIADSIIQGFRQGKRAVEDFAEDVEELLRRAILSGFKYRFLEGPLNELLNQLFEDAQSGDGLSSDEIERFTQAYNHITQSALDALKELEAATGMSLSDPMGAGQQRGLAGAIRREITESTASELAGLWRGTFDITKRHLQVSEASLEVERKLYDTTLTIMQSTVRIEQNTGNTVEALEDALDELRIIARNTKSSSTGRDLGIDGG